jgi:periplasmic copper chaperone A
MTAPAADQSADRGHSRPGSETWPTMLARAAAAPVICAAVLTGLLSAWVSGNGAGTLTRVRIRVTLAAVPMRAYTPAASKAVHSAGTYLTITNLGATADELIAVRSPVARRIAFTERADLGGSTVTVPALTIPGHGTLTLTPVSDDVVLLDPGWFEGSKTVRLTLVFRHAGQVTIDAPVTDPGTW